MLKLKYFLTIFVLFCQVLQILGLGNYHGISELIRGLFSQLCLIILVFLIDHSLQLKTTLEKTLKLAISTIVVVFLGHQFLLRPIINSNIPLGVEFSFTQSLGLSLFWSERGASQSLYFITIIVTSLWLALFLSKNDFFKRLIQRLKSRHLLFVGLLSLLLEVSLPLTTMGFPHLSLNPITYNAFYRLQNITPPKKRKSFKVKLPQTSSVDVLLYIPGLSYSFYKSSLMKDLKEVIKENDLKASSWLSESQLNPVPVPKALCPSKDSCLFKGNQNSYLFYQGFLDDSKVQELKKNSGINFLVTSENPNHSDEVILKNILGFLKTQRGNPALVIGHLISMSPPYKIGPYFNEKATAISNLDNLLASFIKTLKKNHPKVRLGIISDNPQTFFLGSPPYQSLENIFISHKDFPFQYIDLDPKEIIKINDRKGLRQLWFKGGKFLKACSNHFANREKCKD